METTNYDRDTKGLNLLNPFFSYKEAINKRASLESLGFDGVVLSGKDTRNLLITDSSNLIENPWHLVKSFKFAFKSTSLEDFGSLAEELILKFHAEFNEDYGDALHFVWYKHLNINDCGEKLKEYSVLIPKEVRKAFREQVKDVTELLDTRIQRLIKQSEQLEQEADNVKDVKESITKYFND